MQPTSSTDFGVGSVLIATDFSVPSRTAVVRGSLLPLAPGASLELLHVLPEERDTALGAFAEKEARARLEELRAVAAETLAHTGNAGHEVVVSIEHGKPEKRIATSAHHGKDELIVLGGTDGATAEHVLRKADVSVLVVKRSADRPYLSPLVAIDFSESSRRALELALRISDPSVETVDLLHVAAAPRPLHFEAAAPALEADQYLSEHQAREELTRFAARIGSKVRFNYLVTTGDPRVRIPETAASLGSDLVALGTKGRTGLAHVLLGSVAETVLHAAACDVLVARAARAHVG